MRKKIRKKFYLKWKKKYYIGNLFISGWFNILRISDLITRYTHVNNWPCPGSKGEKEERKICKLKAEHSTINLKVLIIPTFSSVDLTFSVGTGWVSDNRTNAFSSDRCTFNVTEASRFSSYASESSGKGLMKVINAQKKVSHSIKNLLDHPKKRSEN